MGNFRKLRVWDIAQQIVIDADQATSKMRGARAASLRDQLMRAAMSVSTNIVERSSQRSPREFARYLGYAIGSVSELEGHVQMARDLKMIAQPDFKSLLGRIVDVRMMLYGLLKKLKDDSHA